MTTYAPTALSAFEPGVRSALAAKKAMAYAEAVKNNEERPDFDINDFIDWLVQLIGLGIFTADQATALVEAARPRETNSPVTLPAALSNPAFPTYDLVKARLDRSALTEDNIIDTLVEILDVLTHIPPIVQAAQAIADAVSGLWHSIFG